jgi:predicted AAA+ superfamily ATPase
MWINRDFLTNLDLTQLLEAILLRGPRQTGKSALLRRLIPAALGQLSFDDLEVRARADSDPKFLLRQTPKPTLIDECHLAPNIFFAIKEAIDTARARRLETGQPTQPATFRMTGSNQTLLERNIQETLAGRISQFYLLGLSSREIWNHRPETRLAELFFRGGFPELWVRPELNPIQFINDYISMFIEKDVARSAGIEKVADFLKLLRLLAARCGELINYESLGNDAGVKGKTVKEWISVLEKNRIIYRLSPYSTNLNSRLIKSPKIYFLDLGICSRLQSHQEQESILFSPHAGHLFENLVLAEIIKTKSNFFRDFELSFWRTKEKAEIDFIVETPSQIFFLEAKMGSAQNHAIEIPPLFLKKSKKLIAAIVTAEGKTEKINPTTHAVRIQDLCEFILQD